MKNTTNRVFFLFEVILNSVNQKLYNMRKSLLFIAAVILFLTFIFSCRKNTQCRTCQTKIEDYFGKVSYLSTLSSINFSEARIWKSNDSTTSELVDIRITNPEYINFNLDINSLTNSAYETQVTVLYLDKLLFSDMSFLEDNIKGVSRFSVSDKLLKHELYQKIDGKYNLLKEVSGDASMITTNTLNLIANNIIFKGAVKNSIVVIVNSNFEGNGSKNNIDILQKRIKKYIKLNQSVSYSGLNSVEPICTSPCPLIGGNNCKMRWGTGYECTYQTSCGGQDIAQNLISTSQMSTDSVNAAFNSTLHYNFRDNFLAKNTFATNFIDYYYELGGIYKDKYTLSVQIQTAMLMFQVNSQLSKLMNTSSNPNQILISSQLKSQIVSLINSYKLIYNDNYTEAVFQEIITELNWAENKTIAQVRIHYS